MEEHIQKTGDQSDTVFSSKYKAHYHSIHGALEESIHVFISAGLFHLHRKGYQRISIFEMGFGTGLNCYLTQMESLALNVSIDYHTIESDPIPAEVASKLNYPTLLSGSLEVFQQMHTLNWNTKHHLSDTFTLNKIKGQLESYTATDTFDLIYYDAFAPSSQPHLWEKDIHEKLYKLLNPGGVLVTYSTQGAFRRTLESIGYRIIKLNGPGKKREMMRATKP